MIEFIFEITTPDGEVYHSEEDELVIFNNKVFIREFDCETGDDYLGDEIKGEFKIINLKIGEEK